MKVCWTVIQCELSYLEVGVMENKILKPKIWILAYIRDDCYQYLHKTIQHIQCAFKLLYTKMLNIIYLGNMELLDIFGCISIYDIYLNIFLL